MNAAVGVILIRMTMTGGANPQLRASGVPYPHINDTSLIQGLQAILQAATLAFVASPLLLATCCVFAWRRRRQKPGTRRARKRQ